MKHMFEVLLQSMHDFIFLLDDIFLQSIYGFAFWLWAAVLGGRLVWGMLITFGALVFLTERKAVWPGFIPPVLYFCLNLYEFWNFFSHLGGWASVMRPLCFINFRF